MDAERFAWAREDEQSIVREHNAKLEEQANALALRMAEDELERDRRSSGSFAESQARLSRALDLLTSRVRPHIL